MTRFFFRSAYFSAVLLCPTIAMAQSLGAAIDFAIVAGSQITAAVGATPTRIRGDVGLAPGSSITGFPPAFVPAPFTLHTANNAASIAAQAAVTALWTDLTTTGGVAAVIPDDLGGQSYGPGTYSLGAALVPSGEVLTLTGAGTYIFRVSSSLTTVSTSNINLIGVDPCNVWWQVGSSATLGGATFAGNVVALTGVNSLGPGATLVGRMLATTPGGVTLAGSNRIDAAFCGVAVPTLSQWMTMLLAGLLCLTAMIALRQRRRAAQLVD